MTLNADFDAQGRLFAVQPVRSSSGKLLPDLDPRQIDDFPEDGAGLLCPRWSDRSQRTEHDHCTNLDTTRPTSLTSKG